MSVAILMSTYNGEKYISQQLDSLLDQTYSNIQIYIRDDGSSDNTFNIIEKYSKKHKNINAIKGKNIGYSASFMELLCKCPQVDYYAFCDQDDFWKKDKIEKAIKKMDKMNDKPLLYYSEVDVVNEKLELIYKTLYTGIDTLGSSFNTAPVIGCTCLINEKLRQVFINNKIPNDCISHELYLYRLCLLIDGIVIHDTNSYILYRQHGNNVVGITNSPIKKMKAYKKFEKKRNLMAKEFLDIYYNYIPEKNFLLVKKIANFYDNKIINKFKLIFDKNYKSKKFKSDLKFLYDVIFEKI